ncbi:hypothetical protein TKK_0016782 [Trichogramma kaykai]|uniref:Hexosyltransferase n=1 Tax=Trichogramma kaykai TaxID=54128 RepID=A0ABD2W452_9HYME
MNLLPRKPRTIFLFGFLFGFLIVCFIEHSKNGTGTSTQIDKGLKTTLYPVQDSASFEKWQENLNIHFSTVDADSHVYGSVSGKNVISEDEWLLQKVSVTCVIFVEKLKLAETIQDTWGRRCNTFIFFSQRLHDDKLGVINLGIKYTSSWHFLCESMNYLWNRRDEISLNWTIFVLDNTYVIAENLRYKLAPLDYKKPHYLGHAVILWGLPYNVAQAGYVLSYGAFEKLMQVYDTHNKCATSGKFWKKEDFYLGKHLRSLGIHPSDTRDREKQGTFTGYPLSTMLRGAIVPDSYIVRAYYPLASKCCSDRLITFRIIDEEKLRTVDYFLHHVRPFINGSHGNKPAPTPFPEDQVWKMALREEFNITDPEKILGSDRYFEIWREKYSDPKHFFDAFRSNRKDHKNVKNR